MEVEALSRISMVINNLDAPATSPIPGAIGPYTGLTRSPTSDIVRYRYRYSCRTYQQAQTLKRAALPPAPRRRWALALVIKLKF